MSRGDTERMTGRVTCFKMSIYAHSGRLGLFASHISAHSDKVAHAESVAGNWAMDGYKFLERWWFA